MSFSVKSFEEKCPYYQHASPSFLHWLTPMFRLIEHFDNGMTWIADSFGGRNYIDRSYTRPCSKSCLCHELCEEHNHHFAFVITKTASRMAVDTNSWDLAGQLQSLGMSCNSTRQDTTYYHSISGFELLKHTDLLQVRLAELRNAPQNWPRLLLAEMSLLIEGILMDHQMFERFGYQNLYEKGYLTFECWKTFQSSRTHQAIDQFDNAFRATSGDEHNAPPFNLSIAARYGWADVLEDHLACGGNPNACYPCGGSESLPLVEAVAHGHQRIVDILLRRGANVIGSEDRNDQSPILIALRKQDSLTISKLLTSFEFLKNLDETDGFRSATILAIDHDIPVELIAESFPRIWEKEGLAGKILATEKRLSCAIFDARIRNDVSVNRPNISNYVSSLREAAASSVLLPNSALELGRNFTRAIQPGYLRAIALKIKAGMDPSLGLSAALSTQNAEALHLLLQRGADPECIIPVKAEAALMDAVSSGNGRFVDRLLKACRGTDCLRNIDFVRDGWTPMMVAARRNDFYTAEKLLCQGANPVFETSNGSALSIARQNASSEVLQILLGGVPISAQPTSRLNKSPILLDHGASISNDLHHDGRGYFARRLAQYRMQKLRRKFIEEHSRFRDMVEEYSRITNMVEEHSRTQDVVEDHYISSYRILERTKPSNHLWIYEVLGLKLFANGLVDYSINDSGDAWEAGMAVMRGLCTGVAPTSVSRSLVFLAIANAVCLLSPNPVSSNRQSQFASDLGRWQILFHTETYKLKYFKHAIKRLWNVDLDTSEPSTNAYPESLSHFRQLAASIARTAEQTFGLQDHSQSLLASQERWHQSHRDGEEHSMDDVGGRKSLIIDSQRNEEKSLQQPHENSEEPLPPDKSHPRSGAQVSIWSRMDRDQTIWKFDPKVILLMAGFIFGVVFAFMLGFQKSLSWTDSKNLLPGFSSVLNAEYLKDAVMHLMCIVENQQKADEDMALKCIKMTLLFHISSGTFTDYCGLLDFIQNHLLAKIGHLGQVAASIHQRLVAAFKLWKSSYLRQEQYQLLQAHLGLRGYRRIVEPTTNDPSVQLHTAEPMLMESEVEAVNLSQSSPEAITPKPSPLESSWTTSPTPLQTGAQTLQTFDIPSETPMSSVTSASTLSDRIIYCNVCNWKFVGAKAVGNLNRHCKDKHDPNKPMYPCRHPGCRSVLSRKAYLKAHEQKQHGGSFES